MKSKNMAISMICLILFLSGCEVPNPNTLAVGTSPREVSSRDEALVLAFLAEQTRDPEAARIRNLVGYAMSNNDRIICGEFNGKNAYGGYVGYGAFYVRFRNEVVMASSWGETGTAFASQACSEAATGTMMIAPN